MIAMAAERTARIEQLIVDPDAAHDSREWVPFDDVDTAGSADVVLSTWADEQDTEPNAPTSLFRAVLPDGTRSTEVRLPHPTRRRAA